MKKCKECGNDKPLKEYHKDNKIKCGYRSVASYTMEGVFITVFHSIHEAAREMGLEASNIHHACNGVIKSTGGFKWVFNGLPRNSKKTAKD